MTKRCNLPLRYKGDKGVDGAVLTYFVGGWCIGTILDAAASRMRGYAGVHTSATCMAHQLNVNIEWWDSDRLHHSFCDDGNIKSRMG